jgi:quinohemoprotein ethanol dehydrogenase
MPFNRTRRHAETARRSLANATRCFLISAGCLIAGQASAGSEASQNESMEVGKDWPSVGGGLSNERYSTLSKIKRSNVRQLGGAWFRELNAPTRTSPVISDGLMIISDASTIYGLDPKLGNTVWEYKPPGTAPSRGGVAIGEGLIFSGLMNSNVIALDPKTGRLVWSSYIGNFPQLFALEKTFGSAERSALERNLNNEFIINAPTYVNGVVTSGLSGGDLGSRGKISGLDAKTGKLLWNFYVIPSPGAKGSETWPKRADGLLQGGGAVWTQGAADAQLGMVYYGTGNPAPPPSGETRAGDNLYTASIVALDVQTGEVKWHYQLTHHDVWEMDVGTPLVLYDAPLRGESHRALAAMRTDGYLFLFDRATGEPLFPIEERPVKQDIRLMTSQTQPFPVHGDKLGPVCADPLTVPDGFEGACNFDPIYFDHQGVVSPLLVTRQAPMSFDPKTGYFYVTGGVTTFWYRRVENPEVLVLARPPGTKEYGLYAAIDSRTQKIVWQKRSPWSLAGSSGALTTAGGLLFLSEGDGTVQASDVKTGETLWQFQTGYLGSSALGHVGGVPISSYEIDGDQYIAVPSGKGLWAFKLGGKLAPLPTPPRPASDYGFSGILKQLPDDGSGQIGVGTMSASSTNENVHFMDEYAFDPIRGRVKAGISFKWINYGTSTHTVIASDGSWSSGAIPPGDSVRVTIKKPGLYEYHLKDSPWAKGELDVR